MRDYREIIKQHKIEVETKLKEYDDECKSILEKNKPTIDEINKLNGLMLQAQSELHAKVAAWPTAKRIQKRMLEIEKRMKCMGLNLPDEFNKAKDKVINYKKELTIIKCMSDTLDSLDNIVDLKQKIAEKKEQDEKAIDMPKL